MTYQPIGRQPCVRKWVDGVDLVDSVDLVEATNPLIFHYVYLATTTTWSTNVHSLPLCLHDWERSEKLDLASSLPSLSDR